MVAFAPVGAGGEVGEGAAVMLADEEYLDSRIDKITSFVLHLFLEAAERQQGEHRE